MRTIKQLLPILCVMVAPWAPVAAQPPLYGLALLLGALVAWPQAQQSAKLNFLRQMDGTLAASQYFMFVGALAILTMTLAGVILFSAH